MQKITMADLNKINSINQNAYLELCRRAFGLVSDKADWRSQVDAFVVEHDLNYEPEVVAHAVEFMTATPCLVRSEVKNGLKGYRFSAMGYRKGPAGP